MRRSAAPSALAEGVKAKRVKFQPPLATNVAASYTALGSVTQQSNAKSNFGTERPYFQPTTIVRRENAPSASLTVSSSLQKSSTKDDEGCSALQRALKELRNGSSEICLSVKSPSAHLPRPAGADVGPTSTANGILPSGPSSSERAGKGGTLGSSMAQRPIAFLPHAPPTSRAAPTVPVGVARHEEGSGQCGVGQEKKESSGPAPTPSESCKYYSVMWCKFSKKKHKKWEGDAFLIACGRSVTLKDTEGKDIGKGTGYKASELASLDEGHTLVIGGKEIEVMNSISASDWESGKCFLGTCTPDVAPTLNHCPRLKKGFQNPQGAQRQQLKLKPCEVKPLHNPTAKGALVMPRPSQAQQWEGNPQCLPLVDVVVDPHLAVHLRPHQREGVTFLYECLNGMRDYAGQGCILADDMGLGKTLQCITLLWTMLKQGMYGGRSVVKKAIIVTPGSLVKNWCREFQKWLGSERLKVYAVSSDNRVEDYMRLSNYPVLIISYEMFVRAYEVVKRMTFDLIVCDEGHRLKNTAIKTTSLISSLPARKRIVLTGTPVQNDLQEFNSIVEFCNPGILGSAAAFRKVYEEPIVLSRQPSATVEERRLGESRANELSRLTSLFCLRRTQDVNNKYLPPKVEKVVFCQPTHIQLQLYRSLLNSRMVRSCFSSLGDTNCHLACILALKKLCNHPSLLFASTAASMNSTEEGQGSSLSMELRSLCPPHLTSGDFSVQDSGKLRVLSTILGQLHAHHQREKIVLISNYTQTLDVFERLCTSVGYLYLRLDGSTPTSKRQGLVEQFNSTHGKETVFLLSSKAGGVGLNLIGASRLVLYDIDWNPANDLQAMARVWRDGQRRKVHIYRLLTTGTIEEKVYQRQVSKQGLSGAVVDAKASAPAQFSREELKDLFSLQENSTCDTHDLIACRCLSDVGGLQEEPSPPRDDPGDAPVSTERSFQLGPAHKGPSLAVGVSQSKNKTMDELLAWEHIPSPLDKDQVNDDLLMAAEEDITFVFQNETNELQPQKDGTCTLSH